MFISRFFSFLFILFSVIPNSALQAQTQDDFTAKMTEVYTNASDPRKALEAAKALYQMVEKSKELQTYSNYFILNQIFENQAKDPELAKKCKEKSDALLAAMTGGVTAASNGGDAQTQWNNVYYPPLFNTTDPENANKAFKFLAQNPSLQNFNNYTYVGYAYERNGEFSKAKSCYEKALTFVKNEKEEFHSYSYYTNFLSRSGEYLKAEEYIRKMEKLSEEASQYLKVSYKAESLSSKVVYYLTIGDFYSYIQASNEQYDYYEYTLNTQMKCNPYSMSRYTITAHGKEMLGEYDAAETLWQKRDSSHLKWISCHNGEFPDHKQYPLSILPTYLVKRGKYNAVKKPLNFYIKETEDHYNSYKEYADISINFMKGTHLALLGSPSYHETFSGILKQISETKNFRESTMPYSQYAYFTMRDGQYVKSKETYEQLFKLNINWINDIIFTFGEKAFVTYYNSKLREGYQNFHSFVKTAKEKQPDLFPELSSQAYNNLLFIKAISLKGTQKRKRAFMQANDSTVIRLYNQWIEKKQELLRSYQKSEDPSSHTHGSPGKDHMAKLQEEVNHLENELTAKSKDFKKHLKIEPVDWKAIRNQLKDGEAAVEMIRFQWRDKIYYSDTAWYAAYIITKNSQYPDVVYLPTLAYDLDHKYYKLYQNNIKFKFKDKESYDRYWKPIKEHLKGIKKVYFSPDGIYHLINLSTLSNPESGGFLLDEMDLHYTTSSNDLQYGSASADIQNAVLIGRPAYHMDSGAPLLALSDESTRSFVRNFRDNNISDLPGTEEEVLKIKEEMKKYSIQVKSFLKDQATEDKIYTLKSPAVLHIATHGYWSELNHTATEGYREFNAMANSGLLLSGVVNYYRSEEFPDTHDGILTAYEAQNLNLENTSLVVLSACETSLGHFDAGEGVYGLQRAFRAAGAKSIMTSLWKVDDEATRDFMILFYQEFLKTKDKFESFRAAQRKLREKYPDPYYWGAFVLTGI